MASETHRITVTPDTTVADILDAADDAPIRIEHDGDTYTIVRGAAETGDIWDGYDPQAVIEMLEDLKHNPIDIKVQQWIDDIYRWREEGSRPEDRP